MHADVYANFSENKKSVIQSHSVDIIYVVNSSSVYIFKINVDKFW